MCEELRAAFEQEAIATGRERLLLTAAVAAGQSTVETAYDIPRISAALDYIHIMSYDLHGAWENTLGHHSQFVAHPNDPSGTILATDYAINYWVNGGLPPSKLVYGMPAYGRGFKMGSADHTPGSPATGSASAGPSTYESGFLAYFEICEKLNQGWTEVYDDTMKSVYAYGDGEWVGYENTQSLAHRCNIINERDYAGVMFWDTSLDDATGSYCGQGKYPLLSMFKDCLQ